MPDDATTPEQTVETTDNIPGEPALGQSGPTPTTEEEWLEALRQVIDPELMVNIVDLGLVYSVAADEEVEHGVAVEMTLTSPACPAGPQIVQQSKMALERLRDINVAKITLTMSPPWTPERMTDDARDQLGIF
jgi:metal-sulfur cluster biosynthetic enzyme